jgi:hypothetical protein
MKLKIHNGIYKPKLNKTELKEVQKIMQIKILDKKGNLVMTFTKEEKKQDV